MWREADGAFEEAIEIDGVCAQSAREFFDGIVPLGMFLHFGEKGIKGGCGVWFFRLGCRTDETRQQMVNGQSQGEGAKRCCLRAVVDFPNFRKGTANGVAAREARGQFGETMEKLAGFCGSKMGKLPLGGCELQLKAMNLQAIGICFETVKGIGLRDKHITRPKVNLLFAVTTKCAVAFQAKDDFDKTRMTMQG